MSSELPSNDQRKVFLLYNERETGIDEIVKHLHALQISTYFFRRDVQPGEDIEKIEDRELRQASTVVVVLGEQGWGRTQRMLAERAVAMQKHIIPVLVGSPPEVALEDVGRLFHERLRVDLSQGKAAYDQLSKVLSAPTPEAHAIPAGEDLGVTPRFDEVLNVIVDGSDVDRSALLDRVIRGDIANRNELAVRIRKSIDEDYGVTRENPPRNEAQIASIRGWLLSVLIWLEPDSAESRDLIRRHIDPDYELNTTVRFWTLAGIIRRSPSYRKRAQDEAQQDDAPVVSALASLAADPNDATLLRGLRRDLRTESYQKVWHVLRVLRVFPVPDLAKDAAAQLERKVEGKSLTYDALYALASPEMAHAAVPALQKRFGVSRFTEIVLNEIRSATPLSQKALARILSVFEFNDVRDALRASSSAGDAPLVGRMLLEISRARQAELPAEPLIAGYASDTIDISKDDIGISRDVETLASVMLARDVVPPLAIGLFGEWGAGKSFFMRSIASTVERISQRAKVQDTGQFCSDVVQIHFNAWHYVDTSLLASLVSHILDGLSSHLAPKDDASDTYAGLTRELESVRAEVAAAKAERSLAAEELLEASQVLQKSILERERQELRLRDLRYGDLVKLLKDNAELKTEVEKALHEVGAPAALESWSELNKVVEQSYSMSGRTAALIASIFTGRSIPWVLGGIILLFIAPPAISYFVERLVSPHAAGLSALAAQVTVLLGSVSTVIGKALGRAKTALDALSEAKRKVDERLAERRSEPTEKEIGLEKAVAKAKANEHAATERVAVVSARAKELEDRVTAIQQGRSLTYFVSERAGSEDYRRHLGLISVVRKDFDGLVQRLRDGQDGFKRVDRIVLYIDDVDRCPPNVVVEILQAVHLLLAYELFVVVVSVDPRWLLHSLEAKYSHLKNEGAVAGSVGTAQDYLDKIFQIPFSVRPMDDLAFGRMMRRLLTPTPAESSEVRDSGFSGSRSDRTPSENPSMSAPDDVESSAVQDKEGETDAPRDLMQLAQALSINDAESAFAERLHALLATPRSAKRFANVYRLLKASLPSRELAVFEGTSGVPGTSQVAMVLLAALIGDPASASSLFPVFLKQAKDGDKEWWRNKSEKAEKEGVARLREAIESLVRDEMFPSDIKTVCDWLPRVARYSFLTARIFLGAR
ncbi:P-loop NTPase fold protein [Paraburkholderia azotifigens]|uniref:P-loop NTPase fold protein n=1 Tax=Paraburkholderia azotifigens TaxID=2057004 RepID=UPI003177432C